MIFTERTITVVNDSATINKPLILYRGDKNIELKITIAESQFKFRNNDASNVIETTDASYAQLVINTPYNSPIFSDVAVTKNGAVIFVITEAMIDEIREVGAYEIQIRLLDDNKQSRASIPPVSNAIEIREPIAIEDGSAVDSNAVNVAKVNRALTTTSAPLEAFDSQGNYIKKTWGDGDTITDAALNKMEAGIEGVNKKIISNNHWKGKKWYACGTSITSSSWGRYVPYLQELSQLNLISNLGVPNGTIANTSNPSIMSSLNSVGDDADLITLEAGVNDWNVNVPLGQFGDTEPTTYYGALYKAFELLTKKPKARIVTFTMHYGTGITEAWKKNSNGNTQKEFNEAMVKMSEMYSVPCIRVAEESGIGKNRFNLYLRDNIHHTDLGGKVFAEYVWEKLKYIPLLSISEITQNVFGNIVLSTSNVTINKGENISFTVKLDKAPTNTQMVTLTSNNNNFVIQNPTLEFTSSNYNLAQTVNITQTSQRVETSVITVATNSTSKTVNISVKDNTSTEPTDVFRDITEEDVEFYNILNPRIAEDGLIDFDRVSSNKYSVMLVTKDPTAEVEFEIGAIEQGFPFIISSESSDQYMSYGTISSVYQTLIWDKNKYSIGESSTLPESSNEIVTNLMEGDRFRVSFNGDNVVLKKLKDTEWAIIFEKQITNIGDKVIGFVFNTGKILNSRIKNVKISV